MSDKKFEWPKITANGVIKIIIVIIIVIFVIMAVFCERQDSRRLSIRPNLIDIKNHKERERELLFYGCFNSENNVTWRWLFITALISSLVISYGFSKIYSDKKKFSFDMFLMLFAVTFATFYIMTSLKTHHLYNNMCGKLRNEELFG